MKTKVRAIKSIREWTADIVKKFHPNAKTLRAVDWYFAAGENDVNVEWSRALDGYSNDHYTPAFLSEFYHASNVVILSDFSIMIEDSIEDCSYALADGYSIIKK